MLAALVPERPDDRIALSTGDPRRCPTNDTKAQENLEGLGRRLGSNSYPYHSVQSLGSTEALAGQRGRPLFQRTYVPTILPSWSRDGSWRATII